MQFVRLGLSLMAGAAIVGSAAAGTPEYVKNQILVRFAPNSTPGLANAAINATVDRIIPDLGIQTIHLPVGMTVQQAISYYKGLPGVVYAEPNYIRHVLLTPNDPKYGQQYGPQKVQAPKAWDLLLGAPSTKIAIVDTGVDYNHEDLTGKVIKGYDFANNDSDPMDDNGHGTHCAGIAAANTNNGKGVAGIAGNDTILAVKVMMGNGTGTGDAIDAGIKFAADNGASVISMSIGGYGRSQAEEDVINYAWNKGAVLVAAAANDGITDHVYPGAFENCICVAATDRNDAKADFSNYGADWVDVAAPGVDIMSTLPGNKYGLDSGTSMATPLVAGVAGLLRAYSPDSTNVEIRNAIESTCDPVGNFIAYGRVNVYRAISTLLRPISKTYVPTAAKIYSESGVTQGTNLSGGYAQLAAEDNKVTSMSSVVQKNVGTVAVLDTTIPITDDLSKVLSASLTTKVNAPKGVTVMVYAGSLSKPVKSFAGTGTLTKFDMKVDNIRSLVSGGSVRVLVRAYVPNVTNRGTSPNFQVSYDQVAINASVSAR